MKHNELREKAIDLLDNKYHSNFGTSKAVDEILSMIAAEMDDAVNDSFRISESAMRNRYDALKAIRQRLMGDE